LHTRLFGDREAMGKAVEATMPLTLDEIRRLV
jgi:hypothetical protein